MGGLHTIKSPLSQIEMDAIFDFIDATGDQEIELPEFMEALHAADPSRSRRAKKSSRVASQNPRKPARPQWRLPSPRKHHIPNRLFKGVDGKKGNYIKAMRVRRLFVGPSEAKVHLARLDAAADPLMSCRMSATRVHEKMKRLEKSTALWRSRDAGDQDAMRVTI